MNSLSKVILCLSAVCLFIGSAAAQKSRNKIEIVPAKDYKAAVFAPSPELQSVLSTAVDEVIKSYADGKLKPEEISATLIDLRNPNDLRMAEVRGEEQIYPASVVKMFYMAALERQLEDGKVTMTPEMERGLRDMIVDSSNEATQYILDVLTDTSSGSELPQEEFEQWQHQRNRVNRYFAAMGYRNINVNQKTFCEDAYGIEQQSRKYKGQNRNMLTTNATARLLAEIVLGRAANAERTKAMMDLIKRDPFAETKDPDDQGHAFSGKALIERKMTGARLWSKAGWVTRERHDAAYIETPEGLKFVIVVFTKNHGSDKELIPAVVGKVIDRMQPIQ